MTYRILDTVALRTWLAQQPELTDRLGGEAADWAIREVSDGNLNTVFLVQGTQGAVCCKQALPHVRVAPDWPMPLERALYESRYMRTVAPAVTGLMPELYAYDAGLFLIVMECLTNHEVLRSALIADRALPGFSAVIGTYVARTVQATGWVGQPFETGARLLEQFSGNTALTRITVDLVMTDPYRICERNPEPEAGLRGDVRRLQTDRNLHNAVGRLQGRFLSVRQALLHGDLHTGSIMLDGSDVRVIDGEFATMGPIGFDCGLYLGNLALHLCAAPHKTTMIRHEMQAFWNSFSNELRASLAQGGGDLWALSAVGSRGDLIGSFLNDILRDTAGFCGLEMIRRTVGFAQVSDYTLCATHDDRLLARQKALQIGQTLIVEGPSLQSFNDVLSLMGL
ncbi:S-methyl-5-thioribose kinase [Gluconobacter kanchanaburiensis]|uniref:S-methyl-5-thioribose kinase n=1 Tax=Gluconobacter kanchanaburiensis NBRC 103587 TaxID=1307948 RepID=A0A511BAZ1_9PROT|nr:S-methyl-5-thioribose kinase [Gluconobacter kanchanaburiensis]MBF0860836.1 S-methyl-5-thioribose kinase [Gluconobacter kanchanaburiensis]GBR69888.1 methylthioribose kinase [Gluconobacter kanchanaburiensis NBRC 103587]GEK94987.1 methylthioribose kinase [Gluconobacter kanchanaburiensis NBRC 103587]